MDTNVPPNEFAVTFEPWELEAMACNGKTGAIKKSAFLQAAGQKALQHVMKRFHPRSSPAAACLKRKVTLRRGVPRTGSWGMLEVHYTVSATARVVHVRTFHVVSRNARANVWLFPQYHHTYKEEA